MARAPKATEVTVCTNIALIKYWGKSSSRENLPAVGSLSLTLKEFTTTTTLTPSPDGKDLFLLNGTPMGLEEELRVRELLKAVPRRSPLSFYTVNNFPTAAGLASSASGGLAAVLAVWVGFSQKWGFSQLVRYALRFSGSAPRSFFGGFVLLRPNRTRRGVIVKALPSPLTEKIRVVVVQCSEGRKEVPTRTAMELSRKTSPYYSRWVATHAHDLRSATLALRRGDLEQLLEIMEWNTLKMHALAFTSRPPVFFWNPVTLSVIQLVRERRRLGWFGWFTLDAGPHVKIFTDAATAPSWASLLKELAGVKSVMIATSGFPPRIVIEGKEWVWQEEISFS